MKFMTTQAKSNDSAVESRKLRVGLVHDWLTGMRGGEKVLELICSVCPGAPLWTLLYLPEKISQPIASCKIHTSWLQRLPMAASKYRLYLPFFPVFAEFCKADGVDLVISSSHAVAKSMVKRRGRERPYHICYIHTPMRYAWDMFDAYFGPERVGWLASTLIFSPIAYFLRFYDKKTTNRVDLFIANSYYIAERVNRLYGRHAEVLHPPVNTKRFLETVRDAQEWYLVVSALVPYKRVDQAIRACSRLRRSLKIVGQGPEMDSLRNLAVELSADVEFVGFASDEMLAEHYRRAKALLFPGIEDFGIVPVEAIACGCPVIALGMGGILDSMTEKTAVFYNEPTVDGLTEAMATFEREDRVFCTAELKDRADQFSETNFLQQFTQILSRVEQKVSLAEWKNQRLPVRAVIPETAVESAETTS